MGIRKLPSLTDRAHHLVAPDNARLVKSFESIEVSYCSPPRADVGLYRSRALDDLADVVKAPQVAFMRKAIFSSARHVSYVHRDQDEDSITLFEESVRLEARDRYGCGLSKKDEILTAPCVD
jgi:hypothetical protein